MHADSKLGAPSNAATDALMTLERNTRASIQQSQYELNEAKTALEHIAKDVESELNKMYAAVDTHAWTRSDSSSAVHPPSARVSIDPTVTISPLGFQVR